MLSADSRGLAGAPASREQESAALGPTSAAVHLQEVIKAFGPVLALAGLTMTVRRGEVFGLLGPNGAGKTTAVKVLLGLTRPSAGDAWTLGLPAGALEARRRIGYLPELFRYQAWLTAHEVLAYHCELSRLPRRAWDAEIDRALGLVGLAARRRDRAGTFSKGMQQRLGLAVAMLGAPELVILDEPTSALDPIGRHDVRELIRSLRAGGATVLLNSHLLSEVERVCDRVAIVDRGRVVASDTLAALTGARPSLRVRVTRLGPAAHQALCRHGDVREESGDWVEVDGVAPDDVPDVVTLLVEHGARVHAVEPRQQSLEDRFLELLSSED
jgi:ABC-2 type transport system ATP-binding protein